MLKIVFVSVKLNIHQANVADELYKLTNGEYHFIETGNNLQGNSKGGQDFSDRPYLIRVANGADAHQKALQLIREADVMIYGAAPLLYLKERVKTGKLTFLYSERWLKRGIINLFSPRLLAQQWFYHTHCHNKPVYALCASAYAAGDFAKMFSFRGKCYKWGYFTQVEELEGIQELRNSEIQERTRILWCGRFIGWKHPEVMVDLAKKLREAKANFEINMIGDGVLKESIEQKIKDTELSSCVNLLGALHNEKVIKAMREHHIACFTSDCNEGWGAVLNEAMTQGCCPVSSIATGSTPYLIKEGVNGFSFNLKKDNDLFEKVMYLIEHPQERERMSIEAYKTMHDVWSPENAARSLITLIEDIQYGRDISIVEGPCSKA